MSYRWVTDDSTQTPTQSIVNRGEIQDWLLILKSRQEGAKINYLISLVKKLQLENLANMADFDSFILNIAEQINQDWWDENGEKFLSDTKK